MNLSMWSDAAKQSAPRCILGSTRVPPKRTLGRIRKLTTSSCSASQVKTVCHPELAKDLHPLVFYRRASLSERSPATSTLRRRAHKRLEVLRRLRMTDCGGSLSRGTGLHLNSQTTPGNHRRATMIAPTGREAFESSSRRDAESNTRDACAPRSEASVFPLKPDYHP